MYIIYIYIHIYIHIHIIHEQLAIVSHLNIHMCTNAAPTYDLTNLSSKKIEEKATTNTRCARNCRLEHFLRCAAAVAPELFSSLRTARSDGAQHYLTTLRTTRWFRNSFDSKVLLTHGSVCQWSFTLYAFTRILAFITYLGLYALRGSMIAGLIYFFTHYAVVRIQNILSLCAAALRLLPGPFWTSTVGGWVNQKPCLGCRLIPVLKPHASWHTLSVDVEKCSTIYAINCLIQHFLIRFW